MKIAIAILALAAAAAQAETIAIVRNAEGGEIIFTDIKNEQCPKGNSVISYGMSGRTLFGCWAPGAIKYDIKDGIVDLVVVADVVWSNGKKSTYPIKRQRAEINPTTSRKSAKGAML